MPKRGVLYALLASLLFGLTTPFSKGLLNHIDPILLAGLFYFGSGVGLSIYRLSRQTSMQSSLRSTDWKFLFGAIIAGGVIAPALLMTGLASTPASAASLCLNMEGVFTCLLAWMIFREHYDLRIFIGMVAIAAGGAVLSFNIGGSISLESGVLLVLAACMGWALDNNLTRKVAHADPTLIASYKGLVAGCVNIALSFAFGSRLPGALDLLVALIVGFLGYGVSLSLYVLALRHIGAARTGAYFAVAPFIGAAVSLFVFREPATWQLLISGMLMSLGLWLHVTEHHSHMHEHEEIEHSHEHVHDEHHLHDHEPLDPPGQPHVHLHKHLKLIHEHPHFPDDHHLHQH